MSFCFFFPEYSQIFCFSFQSDSSLRDHSSIDDDSLDQSGLSEDNAMVIDIDGKTSNQLNFGFRDFLFQPKIMLF